MARSLVHMRLIILLLFYTIAANRSLNYFWHSYFGIIIIVLL